MTSWKRRSNYCTRMGTPSSDWIACARRATLRLHATTHNARGASHNVYVALLEDRRRACRWGLYVGETSRDPDVRFDQHKTGYKASQSVHRFGVRLLPELVTHLNPLRRWEAVELEAALAQELTRGGCYLGRRWPLKEERHAPKSDMSVSPERRHSAA